MSWTHSSRLLAVGVLLAITLGVAGTAAAATISVAEEPDVVTEGEEVTVEVVVEDPHPPSNWTLSGETELNNAQWSIEARNIDDEVIDYDDGSPEGQTFEQQIDSAQSTNEITIRVSGDAPTINEFNYEDIEEEKYVAMRLEQDGSLIGDEEIRAHRYKADSKHQEARQKLDEVKESVDNSDSDSAQNNFDRAVSLYDAGQFEDAIAAAEDAESDAQNEEQSQQLLLFGGVAVVLIVILGGGFYLYSQRQQDTNKLQ